MRKRPDGFLADIFQDGDKEVASYIRELHEYLWEFVRCEIPGASGSLSDFVANAILLAKTRIKPTVRATPKLDCTIQILEDAIANLEARDLLEALKEIRDILKERK